MNNICGMIINADDFGMTDSCTEAIKDAFAEGIISGVSLMANGEAFDKAALYAREQEKLRMHIGVHFCLTEGKPLSKEMQKDGRFVTSGKFNSFFKDPKSNFAFLSKEDKIAVYKEFTAQVERIRNAGIPVFHADSHHHIHTRCCISDIFFRVCNEYGIESVRIYRSIKTSMPRYIVKKDYMRKMNRYRKVGSDYYGSLNEFEPFDAGVWEAEVHPDYIHEKLIDRIDRYKPEDYETKPSLKEQIQCVLQGRRLISWQEIGEEKRNAGV